MEALKAREAELEEQRKQEVLAEQRRRLEEERIKAEAQIQKKLQLRQQELALREKLLKNFKVTVCSVWKETVDWHSFL